MNENDYDKQSNEELIQEQKYKIGNGVFIVKPVFRDTGENTLSSALIRLMRSEVDNIIVS